MRLFSTSKVVRQLQKHDVTKWDCLVHQRLLDNFINTMWQSETVWYLKGGQISSQTRWDEKRLFSTSMVVTQLHKHDGTMWDCLVPQCLSDNFNGRQITSQTRWDKERLFSSSMVVRQLHKHDGTKWDFSTSRVIRQFHKHNGTKWDCLVPQWLSDHTHYGTKWDCLVHQGLQDNFANTMEQSETV